MEHKMYNEEDEEGEREKEEQAVGSNGGNESWEPLGKCDIM